MATPPVNNAQQRQLLDNSPLADREERNVIFAVLDSFRQYRKNCHYNTTHRRRQNLYALPRKTWSVLASDPINLLDTLNHIDDAIDQNADLADAILHLGLETFGVPMHPNAISEFNWHGTAKSSDMAKAHTTIRQFYRDWSDDGFRGEVRPILMVILSALEAEGLRPTSQSTSKVLLPGAGLARLLFELCMAGYDVEGNEISYHQLLASNFVLNRTKMARQYAIYPFATTFTNQLSRQNQLKRVLVPDIHPGTTMAAHSQAAAHGEGVVGQMNMSAGDFLTSYMTTESEKTFDAVVTVYFIDTAPNLVRYIETIRHCLRTEGLWINVGPLLWHFDDRRSGLEPGDTDMPSRQNVLDTEDAGIGEPGSFELTDEEVLLLIEQMGFDIVKQGLLPDAYGGYIQDPNSMVQSCYRCSHWVARKR